MSCNTDKICEDVSCEPLPDYSHSVQVTNIWAVGNCGLTPSNPNAKAVADLINNSLCDRLLALGNLRYTDPYSATVGQLYNRLFLSKKLHPIPGNEDWDFNDLDDYELFFGVPRNHIVRVGDLEIYMLDSGWKSDYSTNYEDDNEEGKFIDTDPRGYGLGFTFEGGSDKWSNFVVQAKASTAKHKIVCIHQPPYCSGNSNWGDVEVSTWGSHLKLRWEAFRRLGIKAVFSSHENVYERLCVDGIPYVVSGLGGAGLGTFGSPPLSESIVRHNESYGAVQITATPDRLFCRFVTVSNQVRDTFEL